MFKIIRFNILLGSRIIYYWSFFIKLNGKILYPKFQFPVTSGLKVKAAVISDLKAILGLTLNAFIGHNFIKIISTPFLN